MPVSTPTAYGHDIDCDSVVEALVREHLTKKQYSSTLAAFQQEQVGASLPVAHVLIVVCLLGCHNA